MAHPQRPRANPEHWNSYRPSYNDHVRDPPTRPPADSDQDVRDAPASSRAHSPSLPPTPPTHDDTTHKNPNLIPVVPRKRNRSPTPEPSPQLLPTVADDGPQLWSTALDDIISQTTRAYDLVINYARDCPAGPRWTTASIARIHDIGKHLHSDVRGLRQWKRQIGELGFTDEKVTHKIREDAERVDKLCQRVKAAIEEEEWVPLNQRTQSVRDSVSPPHSCSRSQTRTPRPQRSRRRRARDHDTWRPESGPDRSRTAGRMGAYVLHY
ncbi:hypothetical protein CC86DRAFT_163022 [Ophiobolus disseminans]|uniref:Uncharacterized protein n=1 Tax=Ophiobolus disseminans TaxID=1469910 RepID=A0A6A7AB80_9PLEO|nr:hypothetical protein CC86DRAFT_163022 [Ophiobolus disseminans]